MTSLIGNAPVAIAGILLQQAADARNAKKYGKIPNASDMQEAVINGRRTSTGTRIWMM
jgi:hypothetical protein